MVNEPGFKTTIDKVLAKQVAERTANAYARVRYTDIGWHRIALRLAQEGANASEIEWILRSKHMRWAADAANRDHSVTAADFAAYVTGPYSIGSFEALLRDARNHAKHDLPATPKTGSDLAGACEGEQIADLIDFARATEEYFRKDFGNPNHALALRAQAILNEITRRAR